MRVTAEGGTNERSRQAAHDRAGYNARGLHSHSLCEHVTPSVTVCRARVTYAHASTTRHSAQAMSFGGTKLIVRFTSPTDRPTSLARGRFPGSVFRVAGSRVGHSAWSDRPRPPRRARRCKFWVGTVRPPRAGRSAAREIFRRVGAVPTPGLHFSETTPPSPDTPRALTVLLECTESVCMQITQMRMRSGRHQQASAD